jgi:methylated-DNA-[protein]-cysteine S-methyltransferase
MTAVPSDRSATETYTVVTTVLGICGVAWNATGLTRVQLPESSVHTTEARLQRRLATRVVGPLPGMIARAAEALQRYCAGERETFASIPLDASALSEFDARILTMLRDVPWGHTTTYGSLAATVGAPDAARAVGAAMARNPWPIIVPCHRVLASGGAMGGFSAYGGTMTKQKLLGLEGYGLGALPLFAQ